MHRVVDRREGADGGGDGVGDGMQAQRHLGDHA